MIEKIIKIQADLVCETGLHLGNQEGGNPPRGVNAPILQNPVLQIRDSFAPYISATSIKGKLRNIAEVLFASNLNNIFKVDEEEGKRKELRRHECNDFEAAKSCPVCFLFGSSSGSGDIVAGTPVDRSQNFAGRLLFKNAYLKESNGKLAVELKTENFIKRLKQEANPRTIERVPKNGFFDFEINYLVFEGENSSIFIKRQMANLIACLRYLEDHYIGGNGSRGYGKISFKNISYNDQPLASFEELQQKLMSMEEVS